MAPDILRPKVINLNILPEKYREPEPPIPTRTIGLLVILLGLLAVAVFLARTRFVSRMNKLETDLQQTQQQVTQMRGQSEEAAKLNQTLSQANTDIQRLQQTYKDIFAGRVNWAAVSNAIFGLAPSEMILTSVRQDAGQVTVKGQAQDERLVTRYIGDLRQTGLFSSVNLESTSPLLTPVVFVTATPAPGETPPTSVAEATVTPAETITPTMTATPTATEVPKADVYEFDEFGNPEPDDFTPKEIIVGAPPKSRNFYPQFDVDKATFLAKAGRQYRVYTSSLAEGVDTVLKVTLGGQTFSNDDQGPGDLSSLVQFENQTGRDQEVLITVTNRGQFGEDKRYFLNVEVGLVERDDFEVDDVIPKPITPGEIQTHNFFPDGDIDKVEFLAKARRWYRVTTSGLAAGVDTRLTVSVGGLVFQNDDIGPGDLASEVTFQATSDSRAVVTVVNLGQFGVSMSYSMGVEEFEPEVPPTHTPTPQPGDVYEPDNVVPKPIALGETQTHTFDPNGDVDKVKFGIKAGRWYIVTTSALALGVDTRLTVSAGGTVLESDDIAPGNLASEVRFQSTVNGTALVTIVNLAIYGPDKSYAITASEFLPTPTPTVTFTPTPTASPTPFLTPTITNTPGPTNTPTITPSPTSTPCVACDEFEPDDVNPKDIFIGAPQVHNFFPAGDVDRVKFLAKAGRRYRVFTSNLGVGVDTVLEVDVGGTMYTNDDRIIGDVTSGSWVGFLVPGGSDLTAFVAISNRGQFGADSTYTLTVEEVGPADQYEVDDSVPRPIGFGEAQSHNFYPDNDLDKVAFGVKIGRWYTVTTSSLAVGVDTHVRVEVGGEVHENDDAGPGIKSSRVLFRAPMDTVATVTIRNLGQYGPDKTYSISTRELPFSPDQFEPDDVTPRPIIVDGAPQVHSFYPDGDIDKVEFDAVGGRRYEIRAQNLTLEAFCPGPPPCAPAISRAADTFLEVSIDGVFIASHDDIAPLTCPVCGGAPAVGDLGSRIVLETIAPGLVGVTISNNPKFGTFAPDITYEVLVRDLGPVASAPQTPLGYMVAWAQQVRDRLHWLTDWLPFSAHPVEAGPPQQDRPVEFVIVLTVRTGQ